MLGSPRSWRRSWSDEGRSAVRPATPDGGFSGIGHAGGHEGSGRTRAVALVEQALVTGQRPGPDRGDAAHQGAEHDEPPEPPGGPASGGAGRWRIGHGRTLELPRSDAENEGSAVVVGCV